MGKKCVVTGGGGFIGAYLVHALVRAGWDVVVVDNLARGDASRLDGIEADITLVQADIRDPASWRNAAAGAQCVFHLAAINGTENFYNRPELVLDVGLRGALAAVEVCRSADIPDLVLASSAEVYQTPAQVPTDEHVALCLPDSLNPRYSYGGSKIISELIAFNYGQDHFRKVQVFRPHNVYGPDMGWKHVVPQFILRALAARDANAPDFPIQGDGTETRAFAYVDDVVAGILRMYEAGQHREIYHIGNDQEISIRDLAMLVGDELGMELRVLAGTEAKGATRRRCPDISKMRALGYAPRIDLKEGLARTAKWYADHRHCEPKNALM